jgi:hypothetical protein
VHAGPGQDLQDRVAARARELGATDVQLGEPTNDVGGGEAGGGAIAPRSLAGAMASTGYKESWQVSARFFRCASPKRPN